MTFYAFGVNHLRAPVEVREAFALDEACLRTLYADVQLREDSELILLSTCNRTEAYLYGAKADVEAVKSALARAAYRLWPEEVSFFLQDEEAVRHILEVSAGLKSLVIGDAQIFSQLKEAYRIAIEEERLGTTMHRLMHTSFRAAKRVINETDLTTGASSIPYVAVEAAIQHLTTSFGQSVDEIRALVIGAGSMGRLAVEALHAFGIRHVSLTRRSGSPGGLSGMVPIAWDARHQVSLDHDVVIVATSAGQPVILAGELDPLGRRTLFVDISVPRNVEAAVAELTGIEVLDIDDLHEFIARTDDLRRRAVPDARRVVAEMQSEFVSWVFHHQSLQPAIQAIADTFEAIRSQEVERHHERFSEADREELDRITRSIIQKILAVPVVRLKGVGPESIDFVRGVRLLHALFRREVCEEHPSPVESTPPEDLQRAACPIEPELSRAHPDEGLAGLALDDVLRMFSGDVHPPS